MIDFGYLSGVGTSYDGRIQKIPKSGDKLQPIYEAFTNAIEAIKEQYENLSNGEITVKIQLTKNLFTENKEDLEFDSVVIKDNGIGFNLEQFSRFLNLDDTSKGIGNKGSGRVQYVHYFDKAEFESVYKDEDSETGFRKRKFTLSKNEAFVKQNAIVRHDSDEVTNENSTYTILKLSHPLDSKERDALKQFSVKEIVENIKNRYIALFCENRNTLPKMLIQRTLNEVIESELFITEDLIPNIDKQEDIEIHYSKVNSDGKIVLGEKTEIINLKGFKINKRDLAKNSLKLTSKGEIAKEIKLDSLKGDDFIDDNRYLFLLSGKVIDSVDSDTRGYLSIPTNDELKKSHGDPNSLFTDEIITLDEIKDTANERISKIYPEIIEHNKEKVIELKALEKMFLLNPETIKDAKIKPSDNEEEVLEKIYVADSKIEARKDIEIKKRIDALNALSPNRKNYQEELKKEVLELTKVIPLQNRTALTQYIARRKMVLDLFKKILKKEIDKLKNGERIDEDLMHNLIFQQTSDNPEDSDLWLINEEFIYFQGTSESKLGALKLNGESIFKENLTEEENSYRLKQSGDAKQRRTDILLFPKEGKCIIIELKAPDCNVSEHLNQINRYASLINNLSKDKFKFNTYYGYLIGESVDIDDIEDNDTDFKSAFGLNYIFRPYKRIAGKFGKEDGALYTEIIKYSTLLERAKLRNEIFIKKLGLDID
jgi:hypothetical protein